MTPTSPWVPGPRVRAVARTINRLGATPVRAGIPVGLVTERILEPDRAQALRRAVSGKVVLVTGASSGIGEAAAIRAARAGATVLLVARSEDRLLALRDDLRSAGADVHAHPCDLTRLEAIDALVERVLAEHGAVDVLVNNAGLSIRRRVMHSRERFHDFERPMALNYFAPVRLSLGLLPAMVDQRRGQVINVSSWAVQVRPARFAAYTASKAALEAWSDCVQAEVLDDGVVLTNIRMPLVRTPMIAPTRAYGRLPALSADQAAAVVVEAMVARSRRVSPMATVLLGAVDALNPQWTDRIRQAAI